MTGRGQYAPVAEEYPEAFEDVHSAFDGLLDQQQQNQTPDPNELIEKLLSGDASLTDHAKMSRRNPQEAQADDFQQRISEAGRIMVAYEIPREDRSELLIAAIREHAYRIADRELQTIETMVSAFADL